MYGPNEHREMLQRMDIVARDTNYVQQMICDLRYDLHDDDANTTWDAREHLRAAILLLVRAEKACKEAKAALPTPAARPDYPAAYDALHEGTPMSDTRYEVYTMGRTSSRTVYAIYDNLRTQPVCRAGTDVPFTFTDKRAAQQAVRELTQC